MPVVLALVLTVGVLVALMRLWNKFMFWMERGIRDQAERLEREEFIKAHAHDMDPDVAGEFWDKYQ